MYNVSIAVPLPVVDCRILTKIIYFNAFKQMSFPSLPGLPYDILGVVTSFVQGCLSPVTTVFGALWSVTQQPRSLPEDPTQAEWLFSTLTCFALSTYIDDNGRDIATLADRVKNLINTWEDSSVCQREARVLTRRLEVRNFRCGL